MKVLITGGYGFIGSHMADRFYKEGYDVLIIDNLTSGNPSNVTIKHRFYNLNVADAKCERIFQTHKIDLIIHLAAQVDVNFSNCHVRLDTESNIMGLVNMLHLSQKYNVKKFIFASSAAVYGDTDQFPTPEDTRLDPTSIYGVNKCLGEDYCHKWREMYGLETRVLRMANVYGPRQGSSTEGGVISKFIRKMLAGEELVIFGDGQQTRDYVYVEDVVDAFYKAAGDGIKGTVFNVSTNIERSLHDLIKILSSFKRDFKLTYKDRRQGDIIRSVLDNTLIREELKWLPKYSFEEGLLKTYQWFVKNAISEEKKKKSDRGIKRITKRVLPYIENIGLFAILTVLSLFANNYNTVITKIGFDFCYFYIIAMGLFYGRRQSFIASILAVALYTTLYVIRGGDFITIIYQPAYILHLLGYLLVGIVTGYTTESRQQQISAKEVELKDLNEQHKFIKKMYRESNQVRQELQEQIINYDDSLGKIYRITKELDTLEKEEVYTSVVQIIEKMMKTESVSLYTVNSNQSFIRLRHRSAKASGVQPNSIRVSDIPYLTEVVIKRKLFVNKELTQDIPLMVSPIVYDGRTIALIQIHELSFGSFNLYHENLLRILTLMITDAAARVSTIENNLKDAKYVPGTRILKSEEFSKILELIKVRKEKSDMEYTLLSIKKGNFDHPELSWRLSTVLREEDYIGLGPENKIFILLLNANSENTKDIIQRIKAALKEPIKVPEEEMENIHAG